MSRAKRFMLPMLAALFFSWQGFAGQCEPCMEPLTADWRQMLCSQVLARYTPEKLEKRKFLVVDDPVPCTVSWIGYAAKEVEGHGFKKFLKSLFASPERIVTKEYRGYAGMYAVREKGILFDNMTYIFYLMDSSGKIIYSTSTYLGDEEIEISSDRFSIVEEVQYYEDQSYSWYEMNFRTTPQADVRLKQFRRTKFKLLPCFS